MKIGNSLVIRGLCLFAMLLLSITLPIHAETVDTRVLHLQTADQTIDLTIDDLKAIGLQKIEVKHDLVFPDVMSYQAVSLRDILKSKNIELKGKLMLVCTDGYTLPLDLNLLNDTSLQPYIALSDLSSDAVGNWQPYKHGREWISLDPFYLVWTGTKKDFPEYSKKLPWPYQLTTMKLNHSELYTAIKPSDDVENTIRNGYSLFVDNCIKCHSVNGVGGKLGPILSAKQGLVKNSDENVLTDFILNINKFYPETAMPTFSKTLTEQQVRDIVHYLKWI